MCGIGFIGLLLGLFYFFLLLFVILCLFGKFLGQVWKAICNK